ncbi:MAG: hypothetical protein MHMPM18_000697 [Marteilia pararefringens]
MHQLLSSSSSSRLFLTTLKASSKRLQATLAPPKQLSFSARLYVDFKPVIYRAIDVARHELGPPKRSDFPLIRAEFKAFFESLARGTLLDNVTFRDLLSHFLVALDVLIFFYVGECIGKGNIVGYRIPGTYIPKTTRSDPSYSFRDFFTTEFDLHTWFQNTIWPFMD